MVHVGKLWIECLLKFVFTFPFQAGSSCKWAHDSQWLILEKFDAICNSPSHIYHYALPFSPSSSWLHESYSAEFLQTVKVVKGLPVWWGACSRTVSFHHTPLSLACWKDTIAVGLRSGDIIILNTLTGTHTSVFSGHTGDVNSVIFSLDGALLVSGSDDKTVKLWDIQTGGVIKTFHGNTDQVRSVSISLDCTMVASGSDDKTIHIWDILTGECHCIIRKHIRCVTSIGFSPINSQLLISASHDGIVQQWDVDGHQIGPEYSGSRAVFSLDSTCFISWHRKIAIVQDSDSGRTIAELHTAKHTLQCCCFSPNGRLVAGAAGDTIYVWDITGPNPHLVETFIGNTNLITSLAFSSSSTLISAYWNLSVKFWQISPSQTNLVPSDPESTPFTPVPIQTVTLQAHAGNTISSDLDGVVRTWDISSGLCIASFQTPAKAYPWRDVQIIDGRLILVWLAAQKKVHIWDVEKGEPLQIVDVSSTSSKFKDLRISEDGTKVFYMNEISIRAWSIFTGEPRGGMRFGDKKPHNHSLIVNGSRVWVHFKGSPTKGWNFGIPGSSPVPLPSGTLDKPCLNFVDGTKDWNTGLPRVEYATTGKAFFQFPEKYINATILQWDGQYLVAGYESGEILILDFGHVIPV